MLGNMRPRVLAGLAGVVLLSLVVAPSPACARGALLKLTDALEAWEMSTRAERLANLFRQENYEALLEALDDIATLFPSAPRAYHLDYLKAEALGRMGRHAQAARLLFDLEAASGNPLGKFALCDAISWAVKTEQWALAEVVAKTLGAKYSLDNLFKQAVSGLAHALYDAGHYEAALAHFERLGEVFRSGDNACFPFMTASCLENLGRTNEACERYLSLLMRETRDDYSARSLKRLLALEPNCQAEKRLGPIFHIAAGEVCLWNHKYADGLRHLSKVSPRSKGAILTKARRTAALCLFKMKDYSTAAERLEVLKKDYREPKDIAWAEVYLGHCYSRLGRHDIAIQHYGAASVSSPDKQKRAKAAFLLGRELEIAGRDDQARTAFESLIQQFPDESYAASARWRLVLAAFGAGDVASGENALSGLIAQGDKTPHYDDASYFMARLRDLQGNYEEAAERYATNYAEFPNVYFGLVSLDRLKELKAEAKVKPSTLTRLVDETLRSAKQLRDQDDAGAYLAALRKAQALSRNGSASWRKTAELRDSFLKTHERTSSLFALNGRPRWAFKTPPVNGTARDVASFFISLGMDDKGARLLHSLSLRKPKDLEALYATIRTFERLGKRNETILLAERAFKRLDDLGLAVSDVPTWFVEALYPRGFSRHVEEYSKTHDVEPAIIYAIIREESRFQVGSVSSAAARGVMQLIAPTAKQVARSLGLDDMSLHELYEPETNIALGVKYLSQLLDRFDGRMVFALASYNGGPSNVERWLKNCPDGVGDDEFINAITFSETRRYAQKVLASYRIYKWLYSGRSKTQSTASEPAAPASPPSG